MSSSERIVPQFIPSLLAILVASEREKGGPLTREEVMEIADNATVVAVTESMNEEMAVHRGYYDLDPNDIWNDWLRHLSGERYDD
jgi:hypothetical protein